MLRLLTSLALTACLCSPALAGEWKVLFDGSSMEGWKVAENPDSVRLEDGNIVLNGKRAHLFWMGEDGKASFTDFEAEIQFKTSANANAGLFFHTSWQEKGWPRQGLECQINASHSDWRKTGSIYSIQDVKTPGHADEEWVTMKLRVTGKQVQVWVNDQLVNEWTQPEDHAPATKRLAGGTFALQAHDPGSVVKVRHFRVRELP